ncbi:MAG: GMC family oxidoreductase [Rhodothermales bacterium]
MFNIISPKVYDVAIIGSGAGGGMAAYVLTQAGADVVMLEAGPMWDAATDGDMFTWNYSSPTRGAGSDEKPFGEFDGCIGGWEIDGEPYTRAPGTEWDWFRARMLGGRTNHWGRISLRFGPDDFRGRSIDGLGDDWPIGYHDVAPYYDKVDRLVGIFGNQDGFYNEPDGIFMPPPAPRLNELLVMEGAKKIGIPVLANRLSIITQAHNGRPACHYCAQCGRGCSTASNFSTPSVLLPPARETGNLTIIPNAMAREVTTDAEGLATGVSYVNKDDLQEYQGRARTVVLAASACESARLLLNSKSPRHPNGLANSSGVVGRYLMDSTGADIIGLFPQLIGRPAYNEDGTGGSHIYIPWFGYDQDLDFARGYHLEVWGGRRQPSYGFGGGIHQYNDLFDERPRGGGGYGLQLKQDYRDLYGAIGGFAARGEMLARYDNYCEIDPDTVDEYGIPVLRFNVTWSDQEYNQVRHAQESARELVRAMGGEVLNPMPSREEGYGILAPGRIIHEVGTVRMGDDPAEAPLNAYCQAHDAKNVFVADGAPFVSQAHKNTTWTILAMAWRTSEHIVELRDEGKL